eukprot:Skav219517  [mRNA]  locus=scaffold30:49575:49928:+ [translate_table: standard]
MVKLRQDLLLKNFLKDHGFSDPCKPIRKSGCFSPKEFLFPKERLYPIHIAAKLGNHELVRILLFKGANPEQKSSKGRTPAEIARAAAVHDSHDMVLMLLVNKVAVLNLRDAVTFMGA